MYASKIIIIYITPSWYMCTEILINQSNWIQYLFSFEFFQKSPSFDFKRVSLTTSNWVWGTESSLILYIYYTHNWVHWSLTHFWAIFYRASWTTLKLSLRSWRTPRFTRGRRWPRSWRVWWKTCPRSAVSSGATRTSSR